MNPGPVKAPIGFLHAYFLIGFSCRSLAQKRSTNPPYPQPRQQADGIRPLAEALRKAIPSWFDTRHAVYRKSSVRHNGLLTPRVRQPWHTDSCHSIVECHFLRSDHPCSGMLTHELIFPVDSSTPPFSDQYWSDYLVDYKQVSPVCATFCTWYSGKGINFLVRQKVSLIQVG